MDDSWEFIVKIFRFDLFVLVFGVFNLKYWGFYGLDENLGLIVSVKRSD